jgi:hypothetical protein
MLPAFGPVARAPPPRASACCQVAGWRGTGSGSAAGTLIRSDVKVVLARFDDSLQLTDRAAPVALDPSRRRRVDLSARETTCVMGWDRIIEQLEAVLLATMNDGSLACHPVVLQAQAPAR